MQIRVTVQNASNDCQILFSNFFVISTFLRWILFFLIFADWNLKPLWVRIYWSSIFIFVTYWKVKVKVLPIEATKALRVGRGIALRYLRPRHWRWRWVVSTTPRPLYPRERSRTHCIAGWVGLRAGLDWCGKSRPSTEIRSPDRPARIPTELSRPLLHTENFQNYSVHH